MNDEHMAPVQLVMCPRCGAMPGDECIGEGTGWHLDRWDVLAESKAKL